MALSRVFTSFDVDHDSDLKILLNGQSKNPDTPFSFADWSVKIAFTGDWKEKAREKIKKCDQMIVICGEHTDTATGVSAEVAIAQEEKIPYFLLKGRADKACVKPKAAKSTDSIYLWSWDNLKKLVGGAR